MEAELIAFILCVIVGTTNFVFGYFYGKKCQRGYDDQGTDFRKRGR